MTEQQPAYVLHSRPWRESSVIADLFTLKQGRVSVMIKGAQKNQGKQPAKRALVQPFTPLMVSFTGRGELRTSVQLESAGAPLSILGNGLYSGLYVNELLLKLLALDDPYPNLFAYYQSLLNQLANNEGIEACLRPFEVHLMDELGYHMVLDKDYITAQPVVAECHYQLHPLQGICLHQVPSNGLGHPVSISGHICGYCPGPGNPCGHIVDWAQKGMHPNSKYGLTAKCCCPQSGCWSELLRYH